MYIASKTIKTHYLFEKTLNGGIKIFYSIYLQLDKIFPSKDSLEIYVHLVRRHVIDICCGGNSYCQHSIKMTLKVKSHIYQAGFRSGRCSEEPKSLQPPLHRIQGWLRHHTPEKATNVMQLNPLLSEIDPTVIHLSVFDISLTFHW